MLARLLQVDPTVFRRIALFTVADSGLPGQLRDFFSLSLICHASYRILREQSAPLFYDIFSTTFDVFGPTNRLKHAYVEEYAEYELKRRVNALNILRRGDINDPELTEAFWVAYTMFEDSDKGHKNVKHLLATDLNVFLSRYIRERLYRDCESNNGWPIPNEQNSLAIALFWFSSSLRSLEKEAGGERDEITRLLRPFVFAAFRRDDSEVCSRTGPTIEDIRYFAEHCNTQFADFPGIDVGVIRGRFDISPTLFLSPTLLQTPSYKLGTLTGKWQGSSIVPFLDHYENWLTTLNSPPEFSTAGRNPLYMSLQEHYVCDPDAVIPIPDVVEGSKNAWLPAGFKWVQKHDGIEVEASNGNDTFKSFYRTFRRGQNLQRDRVVDVIITGKTDGRHAAAWGAYAICGRIRLDDGLVMLSRKPVCGPSRLGMYFVLNTH
ncbi:hypothetical protein H0H92_011470 [Tricholoma furcatifolium]|nr:hypothetical protein H0H92_011470 [Tricholoma furcatifolium]